MAVAAETDPIRTKLRSLQLPSVPWSVGGLLVICVCTALYCLAEVTLVQFGLNQGPDSPICAGSDFEQFGICICPRNTVCVKDAKSFVFLVLARLSAYFDYPLYVLLFLSKAHNLRGFLQRSNLSEFLPLDDLHHLHTFAGTLVGFEVIWHSFWHMLRWGLGGNLQLLWRHQTGISGLVALLVTPLIAFPMLFKKLRKGINFELRKTLHYLSIVWGISICFHAPQRHISIIMGTAVGIYLIDWAYGYFFAIYHLPTLQMTRLGSVVEVVWKHPKGFVNPGAGYVYINLPWIDKTQWHAFSLVSHPTLADHSCVCMAVVGDWTKDVHDKLAKPSARSGWVYGPFPSPFSTGIAKENLILVASGIGITPSISTIINLAETRKVHLIWMCRDADLVEFYMSKIAFDDDAWSFIFYTGKRKLVLGARPENPLVKIILGRPQLEELILSLVDNENTDKPLPKNLMNRVRTSAAEIFDKEPIIRFIDALERCMTTYTTAELFNMGIDHTDPVDGCKAEAISLKGFVAMIHQAGINIDGGLTDEELAEYFHKVDADGNNNLDREELDAVITTLRAAATEDEGGDAERGERGLGLRVAFAQSGRRNSETRTLLDSSDRSRKVMTEGWQMMYCGGAAPVVSQLKDIRKKYRMSLKVESFAW